MICISQKSTFYSQQNTETIQQIQSETILFQEKYVFISNLMSATYPKKVGAWTIKGLKSKWC